MRAKPSLRVTRKTNGRSLSELAAAVDIDKSYLSLIERDIKGAAPPTARRIADELGAPLEDLFLVEETAA